MGVSLVELVSQHVNWLDGVLLLVLLWGGQRGYHRGFVGSFVGLLSLIIAFPVAGFLTPDAAALVNRKWQLTQSVAEFLGKYVVLPEIMSSTELSSASIGQLLEQLKTQQLPTVYVDAVGEVLADLVTAASTHGAQTVDEFIWFSMAVVLLNTFLFLVFFTLVRGVITTATAGITRRADLGVIGLFNRLAGMGFGIAASAVFLIVLLGVVTPLVGIGFLGLAKASVSGSMLAQGFLKVFYLVSPWVTQVGRLTPRW